ncbi:MAG: Thioredoxin [candidate division CPR2 bacterium GW2011_GWC1_39_9]|uniref:Thioredoxin n=1 Tax=candidate division CPR2 bacterium GW2011_GWC2_39_10 TaxID=1618345 RepID=A0A0G0M0U5_UNCC2|nr:MAG: Thioredoxin [candidate division CPR2 bacterium GW2011_GWC2_39_10]KKR35920.1 MAG: Thioredoxin [candidate division CPR2 bacterium GW2011_GWC1_39_9]
MASVKEISDNEFNDEVLNSDNVVLVDFWAPWCGPCQAMSPILNKVAQDVKEIKFVKVNVDENPEASNSFGVMSIPTLLIFKDGKVVDQMIGLQSEDSLKSKLKQV